MSRRQSGGISGRCVMVAGVADYIDEPRSTVRQQREKTVREERKSWRERYGTDNRAARQVSPAATWSSDTNTFIVKVSDFKDSFKFIQTCTCCLKSIFFQNCVGLRCVYMFCVSRQEKEKKKLWTHDQCSSAQTNNFVLLIIQVCRWWRCISVCRGQWRPLICNPRKRAGTWRQTAVSAQVHLQMKPLWNASENTRCVSAVGSLCSAVLLL